MNEFQSINTGVGLLKDDYQSDISRALARRRQKLGDKIVVPTKEDLEASGGQDE